MSAASKTFSALSSRRVGWLLALPTVGIILLVAVVVALLWVLHKNEVEEDRATLIKDVLWLEQNLRFHVTGTEEQLQQLASNSPAEPTATSCSACGLPTRCATTRISSKCSGSTPAGLPSTRFAGGKPDQEIESFARRSPKSLRNRLPPGESAPIANRTSARETTAIFNWSCRFSEHRLTGVLAAVHPIDALLTELVPRWFSRNTWSR